jgi:hypothetical protein
MTFEEQKHLKTGNIFMLLQMVSYHPIASVVWQWSTSLDHFIGNNHVNLFKTV